MSGRPKDNGKLGRHRLVEAEIVATAATVFATEGYRKARLEDIAAGLGVTRGALYTYINSKTDLLRKVMERLAASAERQIRELEGARDRPPADRLALAIRMTAGLFDEHGDAVRVFLRDRAELPADVERSHRRWEQRLERAVRDIIDEGMADGSFRPFHPGIVAFATFGMINWMYTWYDPRGELPSAAIAEIFADLLMNGLIAPASNSLPAPVELTLAELRQNLDKLTQQLAGRRDAVQSKGL